MPVPFSDEHTTSGTSASSFSCFCWGGILLHLLLAAELVDASSAPRRTAAPASCKNRSCSRRSGRLVADVHEHFPDASAILVEVALDEPTGWPDFDTFA